jgi:hypothetical protein
VFSQRSRTTMVASMRWTDRIDEKTMLMGIRFIPPGPVGPGCDHGSTQAHQPATIRRQVTDNGHAKAASAFVSLADEQCEQVVDVALELAEAGRGVAVAEIARPAPQKPVQVIHHHLDRQPQPGAHRQGGDVLPAELHCPIAGPGGQKRYTTPAVDAPRPHHPVVKTEKVETFPAHRHFDDAGLGLLRRQTEIGQQLPQPRQCGLGLLPGFAHHQQVVGEKHQQTETADVPILVEPVQVHIAQQRADHTPLRGAGDWVSDDAGFHYSRPHHGAQQLEHQLVTHPFGDRLHQPVMRYRRKARRGRLHLTLRTARLHTRKTGVLDAGLRHRPFPDDTASLLPGPLAATRTGLTPASDDELTNQPSITYMINHQLSGCIGGQR